MGVSTGTAHPAVKDSKSRPITAGGFVDGAPVVFIDVTAQEGFDRFHHRSGTVEKRTILETPGSGVALLDYDNDGWLDVFLLNGPTFDALKGQELRRDRCSFTTITTARFTDVTEKAGVSNERWGLGVAVGDYDNDGWPDIYVANYGKNRLYHNNHDGTFTDVVEKAGVTLGGWSTAPTWDGGIHEYDPEVDEGKHESRNPGFVPRRVPAWPCRSPGNFVSAGHCTGFHLGPRLGTRCLLRDRCGSSRPRSATVPDSGA